MLKLFRRIRKDHISNGKTSKYLKYAVGEVFLVMIGILLALQVSNWNENRKLKAQQQTFLKSIKQDLKADVNYLKDFITKVELSNELLKKQRDRVNQTSFRKDSLINFIRNDINVFMVSFAGFNNSTYESLKMSGKVDLLNDPLKNYLFELSVMQEKGLEEYETLRNDYFDKIEVLIATYPISTSFSFIKNGDNYDFIWKDISEKDLALKLNSWGTGKANFYRIIIMNFTKALKKTESILSIMK